MAFVRWLDKRGNLLSTQRKTSQGTAECQQLTQLRVLSGFQIARFLCENQAWPPFFLLLGRLEAPMA